MKRLLTVAAVLVVLLSGCSSKGGGKNDDGAGSGSGSESGPGAGAAEPESANASVQAPVWSVGQSWAWTLSSQVLQQELEVTTTVLAADGSTYDVGTDSTAAMVGAYPFHLVGVGAIDAATLAWQAHGKPVQLLRFPLKDNDTFTTDLWGAPGAQVVLAAANVTGPSGLVPGFTSTASYSGGGIFLQADYAPGIGQFVRVASYFGGTEPFAQMVLKGVVATPASPSAYRVTDLGRIAASSMDPASQTPVTGTPPAGAETVVLSCFMGNAQSANAELNGPAAPSLCSYGGPLLPPYNWAYGPIQGTGPFTLTAQVPAGSATFEAFAVDTTA